MIVKELIKAIDYDSMSPEMVCKFVKKQGFRQIGGGAFSKTFAKQNVPFVVKVNMHNDPAAFKFHSMVAGKSSRYFPKIHKLKTYVDQRGSYRFIAIMERLHHLHKINLSCINEQSKGFISWLTLHPKSVIHNHDFGDVKELANTWKRYNSASIATIQSILNSTSAYGFIDLHNDNLMARLPTGDIVLTDPVGSR